MPTGRGSAQGAYIIELVGMVLLVGTAAEQTMRHNVVTEDGFLDVRYILLALVDGNNNNDDDRHDDDGNNNDDDGHVDYDAPNIDEDPNFEIAQLQRQLEQLQTAPSDLEEYSDYLEDADQQGHENAANLSQQHLEYTANSIFLPREVSAGFNYAFHVLDDL